MNNKKILLYNPNPLSKYWLAIQAPLALLAISRIIKECRENNWLKTLNWDGYNMKQPAEFILRKIFSLRDVDDLKYWLRAV